MCRRAVADLAGAKVAVRRPHAITHTTLESMRVPVTPVSEAVQRSQGSADPQAAKQPSGAPQKDSIVRRLGWLLRGRTVEAEEEGAASDGWDPRWQLRRASRRKRCTTTNWAGRVVSETVHEVTEVTDHLGRLHSARVATYERGQLVSEAAALYLPQGLAGKAVSGTAAASLAAGAVGSRAMAGALGAAAAAGPSSCEASGSTCAVGYVFANGKTTFGVLKDPEALGLPQQRAVSRAAVDRVRPPPWQPSSASTTPLRPSAADSRTTPTLRPSATDSRTTLPLRPSAADSRTTPLRRSAADSRSGT